MRRHLRPDFYLLVLTAAFAWLHGPCPAPAETAEARSTLQAPSNLQCEYQTNPLGLDMAKPRLSWQVNDARRGARQTAYQVLVASTPEMLTNNQGDLWDSGRVASDQSVHVEYAGTPLTSRQRCFWKVRTWDQDGAVSPFSEAAHWEMALLSAEDWKAQWVEPAELEIVNRPIKLSPWYWHPTVQGDNTTVYFRTEITYGDDRPSPHHAIAAITADNHYELYVNGVRVAADGDFPKAEWHYLWGGANLHRGRNVIAVKVQNADGPAGLTMAVRQTFYGGEIIELQPSEWLCSDRPADNWFKPDFQPKDWVAAKAIANPDDAPWGPITQTYDGPRRSNMLRKQFQLPADVTQARAYVSGLGYYRLRLNGRRIGHDEFTPGWTLYEKRCQYQVYDVTKQLHQGENAVGALLGNGWWSSGLGWAGGHERHAKPGENLRFLLQLEVQCADGSQHTILTNGTWASHVSPILEDTLYHGETYDARLEQPGWDTADFSAADQWKPAKPVEYRPAIMCVQKAPPLRITGQLKPVKITEPKPGVYVLDFGQNHPGRPKLTVNAPAGTTIKIQHAEILRPDGLIDSVNYRSARVTDTYICKGTGTEVWQPKFTYRGFRYAQVTGLPEKPTADTIVAQVVHTAAPPAGKFTCSNRLVNRIVKNVLWGQRSNMHSVPTDCPQRDERLGWMGDAQAFAPTSIWNMNMALFYTKWMRDILDSQHPNGATTGVCPRIVVDGAGRAAWADAVSVVPWRIYEYYGDRHVLEENYEGVKKWVEYIRANLQNDLYEKPTWGDWVPVVTTPELPVSACYGFYSTKLLAQMADALGKQDEAEEYEALAKRQAKAFHAKYYHPETANYVTGTQTSNLLPLAFGMVPPEFQQAVADSVARDVAEHGYHHTTGFLGTPVILPMLAKYGHAEAAWRIASSDEYPSLGYMVKKGATTIWERWNTDQMGPEMNSRNHFAFGAMAQWFFEGLAGIQLDPDVPGFKHFIVRPEVVGDLNWVKADYPSPYGRIACDWRRDDDGSLRLHVVVPANTTATVYLPTAEVSSVRESGKPLAEAAAVHQRGVQGNRVVVDLPAGDYQFVAQLPGQK